MPVMAMGLEHMVCVQHSCCMSHSPRPNSLLGQSNPTRLTSSSIYELTLIKESLVNKINEVTVSGKSSQQKLWRMDSSSDSVTNLCPLTIKTSPSLPGLPFAHPEVTIPTNEALGVKVLWKLLYTVL